MRLVEILLARSYSTIRRERQCFSLSQLILSFSFRSISSFYSPFFPSLFLSIPDLSLAPFEHVESQGRIYSRSGYIGKRVRNKHVSARPVIRLPSSSSAIANRLRSSMEIETIDAKMEGTKGELFYLRPCVRRTIKSRARNGWGQRDVCVYKRGATLTHRYHETACPLFSPMTSCRGVS